MTEKEFYSIVKPREDWSFSHISRAETSEITHSYHKYPAKFIPQLARAIIEEYTNKNEVIWDPFCGSGTLNLEAFRTERHSIGTDINPVAILISKVKTTPLVPDVLENFCDDLLHSIDSVPKRDMSFYISEDIMNGNIGVLKKWFSKESLIELGHILWILKNTNKGDYQYFALCAFSSVLKRSSYWLNSSVKCQFDPTKNPKSPGFYFRDQIYKMKKTNYLFFEEARRNSTNVQIFIHDAKKNLNLPDTKIDFVITSPPYLVSYDYSDIFRLSTYFLFYDDFSDQENYQYFRKKFIGTLLRKTENDHLALDLHKFEKIHLINDTSLKRSLLEYYKDMKLFFESVRNILKENGRLIMVIGDSEFRKVKIPNAYFLSLIAENNGWILEDVFERDVPARILPSARDPNTGKFCARKNKNYSEIYKKEYVLVFRR
jgi:DNA modification methylase